MFAKCPASCVNTSIPFDAAVSVITTWFRPEVERSALAKRYWIYNKFILKGGRT